MITNITSDLKCCGIYKITYDNNKIYIGQSTNIYARALEHNSKNRQVCDQALKKHDAKIEVLEIVKDIQLLDQIETKWIKFYNATNRNIGYNLIAEGNASGKKGTEHINASFSQDEIEVIYDLLINHTEISIKEIAKKYNVHMETIRRISLGFSYYNENLSYPLREKNNHEAAKKDKLLDYFSSEEDLLNLKEDLLYRWDLMIENDLADKYKIPLDIVRQINQGKFLSEYGDYEYPIRNKNVRNSNNLSIDNILFILDKLRNSRMTMEDIGKKFNIGRKAVSNINKGLTYKIKNYDYPARKTK